MADTSAWARLNQREPEWVRAAEDDRIITCAVVELELLYSARTPADVLGVREQLGALRALPVTRAVAEAATAAVVELAANGPAGAHRVPPADALIAACAADHGCAVLHYDEHYDRLATVLGFASVWMAPRGSLA